MKPLTDLRDELANEYAETHSIFTTELYGNILADFKTGFNAANAEWLKLAEELVRALEQIDVGTGTTSWTDQLIARAALSNYYAKTGGKK